MKVFYTPVIACLSLIFSAYAVSAQTDAFHKGALLVSVSEGQTWANYTTENTSTNYTDGGYNHGGRDPISLEYGLSKRWGVGLTSGADIYNIDPSRLYGFGTPGSPVKATTSEFTVDGHYHFFVTHKIDVSALVSAGGFSVSMKGNEGDYAYKYQSGGNIIRGGVRGTFYFFKRLGFFGTLSAFAAKSSPNGVKGNTIANNYTTNISGGALEFGFCFRFF
jgi:hypothetical protein